jgi:hypothetical protein
MVGFLEDFEICGRADVRTVLTFDAEACPTFARREQTLIKLCNPGGICMELSMVVWQGTFRLCKHLCLSNRIHKG